MTDKKRKGNMREKSISIATQSLIQLMKQRKQEWEKAGIIPIIRAGVVIEC